MRIIIVAVFLFCALCITGAHGYSISGNRVLGPDGSVVHLRGMNRPSLEWQADGQYLSLEDYTLMKSKNANIVRLPLNQVFWMTEATGSASPAMKYTDRVDQQVSWIKSLGMGVILDLHWSEGTGSGVGQQCMADGNSVTFWSQVAAKYKNDPHIIFELYNEPHDVSWEVWRNGGSGCGFNVAGMQQMFNAVRDAGADNVVIVNGLNYAYDLSQLPAYLLEGSNILYGTHPYNFPGKLESDWDAGFGYLAANYPLIATEFGQYCATTNYVANLLAYFELKSIHWIGWAWWVQDCNFPSIISDWNGTPAGAVGTAVFEALARNPANAETPNTNQPTEQQPTNQPTEQQPTDQQPTEQQPTDQQPTEQQPTTDPTTGNTATIRVHEGSNQWWMAVTSITLGEHSIASVELKDASEGAAWKPFPHSWAYVYLAAPDQFKLPISLKITTTNNDVAELDGVITKFDANPITAQFQLA